MDFKKILAWFFDGFAHVCPKSRFCNFFLIGKLLFSRIRACKNQAKIHQKSMQISYGKIKSKKCSRNGFGTVLGSIWEGVGALWGVFWSLLGASWPFRGRSKSSFCKALVQNGLQEGFWSILGRFCEGFGGISGGFRKVLGGFGPNLGWILDELGGKSGGAMTNLKKSWGTVSK